MPKRKRTAEAGREEALPTEPSQQVPPNDTSQKGPATDQSSASLLMRRAAKKRKRSNSKKKKNEGPKGSNRSTSSKPTTGGGQKHILNGLTLAVTTLDKKREGASSYADSSNSQQQQQQQLSWKNTIDKCKQYGATITSQVHKRVHALIVSDAAVRNATQRVRKALKLGIPIVDIGWIEACIRDGNRIDWAEYMRNDEAKEAADSKKKAASTDGGEGCDVKFDVSADDANAVSGWSEPVELDCCCVCHENGDLVCPWCTGETKCNLTKKRQNN